MGAQLSVAQRREARRLRAEGLKVAEVAREIGCSLRTINRVLAAKGKREERVTWWSPSRARLALSEREEISRGLGGGLSFAAIAQ